MLTGRQPPPTSALLQTSSLSVLLPSLPFLLPATFWVRMRVSWHMVICTHDSTPCLTCKGAASCCVMHALPSLGCGCAACFAYHDALAGKPLLTVTFDLGLQWEAGVAAQGAHRFNERGETRMLCFTCPV